MEREFFSVPWSEASIAHYYEAGNTIFVVARSDEERDAGENGRDGNVFRTVVGYAAVFCSGDEGNLVSIGVDADHRNMGIATELLDIVYDMAAGRGVRSINLEVRESNLPAVRLYEQEGFEKAGKRPGFYRNPEEDALIYIKTLI